MKEKSCLDAASNFRTPFWKLSPSFLYSSKISLGKASFWIGKVPQTIGGTEPKPGIKNQELCQRLEPSNMGRGCKDSQSSTRCEPRECGSLPFGKLSMGFHLVLQLLSSSILKAPLNTCHCALIWPWRIALWALQLLLKLWELNNFLEIAGSAITKWPF